MEQQVNHKDFILLENDYLRGLTNLMLEFALKARPLVSEEHRQLLHNAFSLSDTVSEDSTYEPTEKDKYILWLLSVNNDINASVASLSYSLILAQETKHNFIPEDELLKYYFKNYLSEVYIFCQRIITLFNTLINKCKKYRLNEEKKQLSDLKDKFVKQFEKHIVVRGIHVHMKEYTDSTFNDLVSLQMKKRYAENRGEGEKAYEEKIKEAKNFYTFIMRTENQKIEKLTNELLNNISGTVLDTIYNKINLSTSRHKKWTKK